MYVEIGPPVTCKRSDISEVTKIDSEDKKGKVQKLKSDKHYD